MLANDDIARIFQEIAEIMELRGDDVFRIRAYLNVARVIDGLAEPLAQIRFGVATARRGWAEPKEVLNTLPLEQFLARLRRNR